MLKVRCNLRLCRDPFYPCNCFGLERKGIDLQLWYRFIECTQMHLLGDLPYSLGFRSLLSSRPIEIQRNLTAPQKLVCGDLRKPQWLRMPNMNRTGLDFWPESQLRDYSNQYLQEVGNPPRLHWFWSLRELGGSSMFQQIILEWEQRIDWIPFHKCSLCWHCEPLFWHDFGGRSFAYRYFRTQKNKKWHVWFSRTRIRMVLKLLSKHRGHSIVQWRL